MGAITALEDFADDCGLELEPFQRRILRAVASGTREVVVLLPRGNGKTALDGARRAAPPRDHAGRQGGRGGRQPRAGRRTCSTTRSASRARSATRTSCTATCELRWYDAAGTAAKHGRSGAGRWRCSPSDAPQAARPDLLAGDRRRAAGARRRVRSTWRWPPRCTSGPGAQLVTISTAGQGTDSPLGQLRARALALPQRDAPRRRDGRPRPRAALPGVDAGRRRRAVAARRSSARTRRRGSRRRRSRTPAPACPTSRSAGSSRTSGPSARSHWLPPGAWQACVTSPAIEDGEPISVGVDVGGQRSATAVAWVTDDLRVGVWIGHGDEAVLDAGDVIRELAARLRGARDRVRPVARRASSRPSWSARAIAVRRLPAVGQPHDPGLARGCTRRSPNGGCSCRTSPSCTRTRRTRSPATAAAAGGSTSRTSARRTTRSSRCAWRSTRSRTGRSRRACSGSCESGAASAAGG